MADRPPLDPAKQARRDRAIAASIGMAVRQDARRRARASGEDTEYGDAGPGDAGAQDREPQDREPASRGSTALTVVVVVVGLIAMLALVLWFGARPT